MTPVSTFATPSYETPPGQTVVVRLPGQPQYSVICFFGHLKWRHSAVFGDLWRRRVEEARGGGAVSSFETCEGDTVLSSET